MYCISFNQLSMTKNFEYEIHPEEERMINRGKMMVLIRMGLAGVVVLVIVGILVFLFADPPGKVYISSNIKGATIYINSFPSEHVTDDLIEDLTSGKHIFSVVKEGFSITGDFTRKIKVLPGRIDSIYFELTKNGKNEDHKEVYGHQSD